MSVTPRSWQDKTVTAGTARSFERQRLDAVRRYDILDSAPDSAFDRIATMAARWFDVPHAAVTIVDANRIWFKASHGLAVSEVAREPGLCGSAILRDEVHVIHDTTADPVASVNSLVVNGPGIRFYAGAPIVTPEGHRLGTLNVLDVKPREFAPADGAMLTDLAAMVMDVLELRVSALRTLRAERELRIQAERDNAELEGFAATLQRTLLPPELPRINGLELASHYKPASTRDVGGDFYDVFSLGGARWAFFLGDVCGKGASAASVTSLVRYTLRAAAFHNDDPVAVLEELNAALLRDTDNGDRFCTVVFGTITPIPAGGFKVRLGTGGHPPAFALRAATEGHAAAAEPVPCAGMLAGALPEATFAATTVRLEPGDGLLLYTDGLTEARPRAKELLGHDGLAGYLDRLVTDGSARTGGGVTAARLTEGLVDLLEGFVGFDDVAILAMMARPVGGPATREPIRRESTKAGLAAQAAADEVATV